MKKIILPLMFILIVAPMILAGNGIEIKISNDTINIRGYTNDPIYGKIDYGIFSKVQDSLSSFITCDNVTIENSTYQENCSFNIDYSKDISLYSPNESSTAIIGDTALQSQLNTCIELKAQYSAGLDSCVKDKATLNDFSKNFSSCSSKLTICENDKINLNKDVDFLKKDAEDKKNRQYWYGLIGLILGAVGFAFKEGKIGGPKTKSAEDTFNPRQAG